MLHCKVRAEHAGFTSSVSDSRARLTRKPAPTPLMARVHAGASLCPHALLPHAVPESLTGRQPQRLSRPAGRLTSGAASRRLRLQTPHAASTAAGGGSGGGVQGGGGGGGGDDDSNAGSSSGDAHLCLHHLAGLHRLIPVGHDKQPSRAYRRRLGGIIAGGRPRCQLNSCSTGRSRQAGEGGWLSDHAAWPTLHPAAVRPRGRLQCHTCPP